MNKPGRGIGVTGGTLEKSNLPSGVLAGGVAGAAAAAGAGEGEPVPPAGVDGLVACTWKTKLMAPTKHRQALNNQCGKFCIKRTFNSAKNFAEKGKMLKEFIKGLLLAEWLYIDMTESY
ncbi:MAG: hypothetical protein AABY47_08845 [Pseudomonadota bacterium]